MKVAAGVAVALVLASAAGAYVALTVERPSVESVENEFGAVSTETATVDTRVVVHNPNDRTLPAATVEYAVAMNDVELATGRKRSVRLRPGRNVVELTARLDNGQIPEWWVTHVERGEQTSLTTRARVRFADLPFTVSLPPDRRRVETDLLGALGGGQDATVRMGDTPLLAVADQRATWGETTSERTPVSVRMDVANEHNRTVSLDGVATEIRMNGVTVGEETADGFALAPGERRTVTVDAGIEPERMQRWWVSHLRRNQTTQLNVTVEGIVERDGERHRVPLGALDTRAVLRTDLLGPGATTVEQLPTRAGPSFERPCVRNVSSRWGEPTDETTPVVTDVTVCNPNEGAVSDLLALTVSRSTSINGLTVAANDTRVDLPRGEHTFGLRTTMRNDEVPAWWARHLNRGERSTVRTTVDGTLDAGVTTFPASVEDETSEVETSLLADLNDDAPQPVTAEGRTVLVVERSRAGWANATPETAPVRLRMRVRNDQPVETTVRDLTYTVGLGNVTLADRTNDDAWTLAPYETRTIETRLLLNNSRMAAWWPEHVRRGERSRLTVDVRATVESGGSTSRTDLEFLGTDRTVETDLLGAENGSER